MQAIERHRPLATQIDENCAASQAKIQALTSVVTAIQAMKGARRKRASFARCASTLTPVSTGSGSTDHSVRHGRRTAR